MSTTESKICELLNQCADLTKITPNNVNKLVDAYMELKEAPIENKRMATQLILQDPLNLPYYITKLLDIICSHYHLIKVYNKDNQLIKIVSNERT